jgi:hypothetical protein
MTPAQLLAGDNAEILQQGLDLLRRLDDRLYAGSDAADPRRGGVGRQFRHLIDFYQCLLGGLDLGRVDYADRERDPRLESDREFAIDALERVIGRLREARLDRHELELWVRMERACLTDGVPMWTRSSLARELQFLLSHTIHHYALIGKELGARGVKFDDGFGVAPSTLRHWTETSRR